MEQWNIGIMDFDLRTRGTCTSEKLLKQRVYSPHKRGTKIALKKDSSL